MGAAGRAWVQRDWTWEAAAQRLSDMLQTGLADYYLQFALSASVSPWLVPLVSTVLQVDCELGSSPRCRARTR